MSEQPKRVSRWTSRKFILAASAQVAALLVLIWPGHEGAIVEASRSVASLLVVMATAMGYISAEAGVDKSRAAQDGGQETDA